MLRRGRDVALKSPPVPWIEERLATLQAVLERRTERSALLLRKILGKIRIEPVTPEVGRPYLRAVSSLEVLALLEIEPAYGDPEAGSNSLHWWRRRESNPRPEKISEGLLRA